MYDINLELRDILKQIDGVNVCFAYPDNFNKLPAIAYYTLTDKGSMSYDNTVVTNDTTVQIDIYADYPQTCFELSERVYKLLTDNEYYDNGRTQSRRQEYKTQNNEIYESSRKE